MEEVNGQTLHHAITRCFFYFKDLFQLGHGVSCLNFSLLTLMTFPRLAETCWMCSLYTAFGLVHLKHSQQVSARGLVLPVMG